jgi:hypothetical protein
MNATLTVPSPQRVSDRFGFLVAQLHTAVELDSFWKASLQLFSASIPHHSCSLL